MRKILKNIEEGLIGIFSFSRTDKKTSSSVANQSSVNTSESTTISNCLDAIAKEMADSVSSSASTAPSSADSCAASTAVSVSTPATAPSPAAMSGDDTPAATPALPAAPGVVPVVPSVSASAVAPSPVAMSGDDTPAATSAPGASPSVASGTAPDGTVPASGEAEEVTIKAVSRRDTRNKLILGVLGGMIKSERNGGVADTIRALNLSGDYYENLLHAFHSDAVDLEACWRGLQDFVTKQGLLAYLPSQAELPEDQRDVILIVDHKVQPREGRRMAGVTKLHQASENVNKSDTVMGQLYGAVGVLLGNQELQYSAVPVYIDIEYGFNATASWACSDVKAETSTSRAVRQAIEVTKHIKRNTICTADTAFFTNINVLQIEQHNKASESKCHLLSRCKSSCVAYEVPPDRKGLPGRPRKKGDKVEFKKVFDEIDTFEREELFIYGRLQPVWYKVKDLLWGQNRILLRFVFCVLEDGRRTSLVSTDPARSGPDCIVTYSTRYKQEKMFREYSQVYGGFSSRFSSWSVPKPDKYKKAGEPEPLAQITDEKRQEKIMENKKAHETYAFVHSVSMTMNQILSFSLDVDCRDILWQRTYRTHRATDRLMNAYLRGVITGGLLSDNDTELSRIVRDAQHYKSRGIHNAEAAQAGLKKAKAAREVQLEAEAIEAEKTRKIRAEEAKKAKEAEKARKAEAKAAEAKAAEAKAAEAKAAEAKAAEAKAVEAKAAEAKSAEAKAAEAKAVEAKAAEAKADEAKVT